MISLPTKEYVDNVIPHLNIENSIPDLSAYVSKPVTMTNKQPIVIRGVTIPAWCQWYFPHVVKVDFTGIAMYPDTSYFFIIGHTVDGYFAYRLR